jgi:hypothetical protein
VIFMMTLAAAVALSYILENIRLSSRNVETLSDRRNADGPDPSVKQQKPAAVKRTDPGVDAGWASGPPSTTNRFSSGSR